MQKITQQLTLFDDSICKLCEHSDFCPAYNFRFSITACRDFVKYDPFLIRNNNPLPKIKDTE